MSYIETREEVRENPRTTGESWKERLYKQYVSGGQAPELAHGGPKAAFRSRAAYHNSIIARYVPKDRQLTVLDIGCGHGTLVYFLQCAGYKNVSGIDASAEQVDLALRLGIPGVYHRKIDEYLAQADESSVDVVLLIDILEHMTRAELFHTLDGVLRILRPGGICISHVPNGEGVFGMATRYADLTHEMAFTSRSALQTFRAVGFKKVKCFEDGPIVHGAVSLVRRVLWELGTLTFRLLYLAETGTASILLSRNIFICSEK